MEQSRDELITENMNLVHATLHRYYPTFAYDDDLIQCGMLGLVRAADTYDASKSKFSTYATRVIVNELRKEFRQRFKPRETVSLSQEIELGDDKVTLEDSLCGDEDIEYVDKETLLAGLTETERKVMDLTAEGFTQREIATKIGCTQPTVGHIIRKIKWKWSKLL